MLRMRFAKTRVRKKREFMTKTALKIQCAVRRSQAKARVDGIRKVKAAERRGSATPQSCSEAAGNAAPRCCISKIRWNSGRSLGQDEFRCDSSAQDVARCTHKEEIQR